MKMLIAEDGCRTVYTMTDLAEKLGMRLTKLHYLVYGAKTITAPGTLLGRRMYYDEDVFLRLVKAIGDAKQ